MVKLSLVSDTERASLFQLLFKRDFPRSLKKELDPGDISRWIPNYQYTVSNALLRASPINSFDGGRDSLTMLYSWIKKADAEGGPNFFPIFFSILGDFDYNFLRFIKKLGLASVKLDARVFSTEIVPTRFEFGSLYLRYTSANAWRFAGKVIKHPGGILYWHLHPSTRGLIH